MNEHPQGIDALPVPRDDDQKRLLLAVWWNAFRERDWPEYASIGRLLYEYGIYTQDLFPRLPDHLLVGWPDANRSLPQPSDPLKLTIAGVAHCPGSNDVVDTFLKLVRAMARIERAWPDSSRPTLRSQDAVAELGLPEGAESEKLLRKVFLLAAAEPWSCYSCSTPGDAHGRLDWELGVDWRIQHFADVEDIGGYWMRRSEQLPPPGWPFGPQPLPVEELFSPRRVVRPDADAWAAQLLLWLYDESDDGPVQFRDLAVFVSDRDLSPEQLQETVDLAAQQHLIAVLEEGDRVSARLGTAGKARARYIMETRLDNDVRFACLIGTLVAAAADAYPSRTLVVQSFLSSPAAAPYGSAFSEEEVWAAIGYLVERCLATLVVEPGQIGPPRALKLTAAGVDCGSHNDINVRGFVTNQQPSINIANVNNYGGANQIGAQNTQYNAFGTPPKDLAQFAQRVLENAERIDLPQEARQQLVNDAQALADEANGGAEPGRLRQLAQQMRASLTQNASDAIAQNFLQMLGGVLGG